MKDVNNLITRLFPDLENGVEYKKLNELGTFYGGLTGKSKKDFGDGNAKFITYMNVYSNPALDLSVTDTVQISEGEKQNKVQYKDILFTGSSETPEESGMTSVVTKEIQEDFFLNSFCFGLRLYNPELFNADFLKHYFRSHEARKTIARTASGVTRFNVSKAKLANFEIPVPPIEVQHKIVEILDNFTELESELEAQLEAELEARRKQYEYYRNQLLTFDLPDGKAGKDKGARFDVKWMKLGEIGMYARERIDGNLLTTENYVGVENLLKDKGGKTSSSFVPSGNAIKFIPGDILIGNIRPYLKKIWLADIVGGTNGDVLCIRVCNNDLISSAYLYKCLSSDSFFNYDNNYAKGGKMPRGDKKAVLEYIIPVPPLEEQQRIVSILDRFEALTTDLQSGLPAEIEARRKQYEYYREQLLTFKRKSA